MTPTKAAQLLFERNDRVDSRVGTLLNRAMLAIVSQPSLLAFLADSGVLVKSDGTTVLQFVFSKLPVEVIPEVERLLSASHPVFTKSTWSAFRMNGQTVNALELVVDVDKLPDYDSEDWTS